MKNNTKAFDSSLEESVRHTDNVIGYIHQKLFQTQDNRIPSNVNTFYESMDHTDWMNQNQEQYNNGQFAEYLNSTKPELSKVADIYTNPAHYKVLRETCLEASQLDAGPTRDAVADILDRFRLDIINESSSMNAPTSYVQGFNTQAFAILTDIYSDPILNQVTTLYSTQQPKFSIPRMFLKATVKEFDGTITEKRFPSNTDIMRSRGIEFTKVFPANKDNIHIPDIYADLITGGAATSSNSRINRKGFVIKKVTLSYNGVTRDHDVMLRTNGDSLFDYTFDFILEPGVANSPSVLAKASGDLNYGTNSLTLLFTYTNARTKQPISGITTISISGNIRLVSKDDPNHLGREFVSILNQRYDVDVDITESFVIKQTVEQIQDFTAIWKIDLYKTYALAIKNQIMKNKDYDLAQVLVDNEIEYKRHGSFFTFDMANYRDMHAMLSPNNIIDLFACIIPTLIACNKVVYRNFNAEPQFYLCGMDTCTMLESLQHYKVSMTNQYTGDIGSSSSSGLGVSNNQSIAFNSKKILYSMHLPTDKIYTVYKTSDSDLSRTVIADIVFKGIYLTEEMQQGNKLTIISTRTAIEILRPDAIGCVQVKNYEEFLNISPLV